MNTLDDIKGFCRLEPADSGSEHWIWCAGLSGQPNRKIARIWGPDHTATKKAFDKAIGLAFRHGDDAAIVDAIAQAMTPRMTSQPGRRAAYHLKTGKPLPTGWRVFATCNERTCIAHFGAGPMRIVGAQIAKLGRHQHSIAHKVANRAIGRARSKLDPDMIREIQQSNETGKALAARYRIGQTLVSKVRCHGSPSHQPVGGLFSGLMGRSA